MNLAVTLVKGEFQTTNVEYNISVFLCNKQGGAFPVDNDFLVKTVRNVRSMRKMIANEPPLSLLQDKSQL